MKPWVTADGSTEADLRHLHAALALARRSLGRVHPNPAVGCVVVREGAVVGVGRTGDGGRPHAEVVALQAARSSARGATAYVSLEPCAHHGVTPPCTDALIGAGVARVVGAVEDPDPRVSGRGFARLRAAGLAVTTGLLADVAADLNAGFFLRVREGRPLFTLKLATSLDGRIATGSGDSRWITGEAARAQGHLLRARHDAVMVGSGTALADDPALTCRLPGLAAASPLRIVADGRLRLSPASQLADSARDVPLWVLTRVGADAERRRALEACGAVVVEISPEADGALAPAAVAACLAERGLTRVLIEGGGKLAAAFVRADLVDRIVWLRAPCVLGGDAVPAVAALAVARVADAPRFTRRGGRALGDDTIETLVRSRYEPV